MSDADLEAAFAAWQQAKQYLLIAQSHLVEATQNGWHTHVPEYRNRCNAYIEKEAEAFRLLMQLRGNSGVSI